MGKKYVGADVHGQSTVFCVLDEQGQQLVGGATVATRKEALLDFVRGLSGEVHLALEEGTQARWFYGLVKPYLKEVIVCNPRRNKPRGPMRNKNDRLDAYSLAKLLRLGELSGVYHGDEEHEELRELVRSYRMLVSDGVRVKNRIKVVFRERGIGVAGDAVFGKKKRGEYLGQVSQAAVRLRLDALYVQMDVGTALVTEAQKSLLKEVRKYSAWRLLQTIPGIGRIGAAVLVSTVGTPFRFPTKQAFWAYCGLAVVCRESGEFEMGPNGRMRRQQRPSQTRGLNRNRNGDLKHVFKTAAITGRQHAEVEAYYQQLVQRGLAVEVARVQVARKLATVAITTWKKGIRYDKAMWSLKTA